MSYKSKLTSQLQTRLSPPEIKKQIIKAGKPAAIGILYLLTIIGFIVLIAKLRDIPIWKITKDSADVMHYSAYIGALSNLGDLLWAMTATVCLFGAIIIRQNPASRITYHFFLASGMFSLLLGMDDLFLLHDHVLPHLLHIPEGVFYLLYLLAIIVYLIYFLPLILGYEYLLLGISVVFFGLSRSVLVIPLSLDPFDTSADILKHIGIVFWLIFFFRTVLQEINTLVHKPDTNNMP